MKFCDLSLILWELVSDIYYYRFEYLACLSRRERTFPENDVFRYEEVGHLWSGKYKRNIT